MRAASCEEVNNNNEYFIFLIYSMSSPIIDKPMTEPEPMNIATISAGFEKGDFLVREEQGNRVYFDFFEEVSRQIQHCMIRLSHSLLSRLTVAVPFVVLLTTITGFQLHLQQGICSHVSRRRKALGGPHECDP
jgi:hypothetical protein